MPPGPAPLAAPEVFAYVLGDLALILVAAWIVGGIFVKLNQPRVVGEIVAGILIGPTVLGGVLAKAATPTAAAVAGDGLVDKIYPLGAFSFLNLLGSVALVIYMFLVGLELDQHLLKGRGRQIMVMALAVVAVPVALGFLAGGVLNSADWKPAGVNATAFAMFLGAGLSVTAFPVMARILQEKGLMSTPMGAVGVGAAAVVTVLMFLVIATAASFAKGSGVVNEVGTKLLLTIGLIVVLIVVVRPLVGLMIKNWEPGRPHNNILAVLLILALATGLVADRIFGSALVGGFLLGAAVPSKPALSELIIERLQDAVVIFLLPVFLAVSGIRTDLKLLTPDLFLGLLLFLALMVVGKWGVGYLAGRSVGLKGHQANLLGVLLNCRGLLILVVGLIGLQLGAITPQMQAVFVVGAIVTTLMTGPLAEVFLKKEQVPTEADRRTSGAAILTG
jgi:Kef-type K+ transport system membrane component KefB